MINGRPIIRVGGGYMSVREFVEQKSKINMMKLKKLEEFRDDKQIKSEVRKSGFKEEAEQLLMDKI